MFGKSTLSSAAGMVGGLSWMGCHRVTSRDVEAEAGSRSSGSGTFFVEAEAEARKIHRFRFHIGGKNRGRKKIDSAILRRRTNGGSINIKK